MATARLGTFEELMTLTEPPLRPVAHRLRELILAIDPGAVEVVRLGDRAATYGLGPRKMIEGYAYILPHASWVNLGFYQGTALDDPAGRLEGTGAMMRHLKVRSEEAADEPWLRDLIEAAISERRRALGR